MGQPISITRKRRKRSGKLFSSQFLNGNNNSLSHTFAVLEDDPIIELVDINCANENELLKVRDIDLQLSKNIIKHRKTIGCYQKVEDLVVVPGMGAKRFDQIKHHVCVNSKNTLKYSFQSFDSLKSTDSKSTLGKPCKLVNINKASIFELQSVNGITQEIAAGIFNYRNKKGQFKQVEQLLKIKSISYILFDNISRSLTVDEEETEITEAVQNGVTPNSCVQSNRQFLNHSNNGVVNGIQNSVIADIFDVLSLYSPRPVINEVFQNSRDGKPAFRIASWNLEDFSIAKASNLGVKEVVCRSILENGWSILAVQNVEHEKALKIVCDELNNPKLYRVEEWTINSHNWNYITSHSENTKLGFIYDASGVVKAEILSLESESDQNFQNMNGIFQIGTNKVQILNLRLEPESRLDEVKNQISKCFNIEVNGLICGDFDEISNHKEFFNDLEFTNVLSQDCLQKNDDFFVNSNILKKCTGSHGVLRYGLHHLAIPNGWNWGGCVSSHFPIWMEVFC